MQEHSQQFRGRAALPACQCPVGTERTRTELGLPDVDQHVGVGAVPHGQVVVVPAVVVLDRLLLRAPRHNVVIEFTPLGRKFYRKVILHVKTCS